MSTPAGGNMIGAYTLATTAASGGKNLSNCTDTHTYTCLTALCPELPRSAGTTKVKPIWILLKQEIVSGSGISWVVLKSAPRSRQITRHTHTHLFNGPLSGTTQVSLYHKGKTNMDFTGARDSEWQWHQLGGIQVCTLLQTDNHARPQHSVFIGQMSFLPPNQQRQSTESINCQTTMESNQ